jgi:hypothetical protein
MKKKPIDFGRLHVQTKPCVPYCMAIYSVSVIVKNHVRLIIHWVGVLSTPSRISRIKKCNCFIEQLDDIDIQCYKDMGIIKH